MHATLDDLLDRTHAAVIAGDMAALAALAPQVEAMLDALPPPDAATGERLRRKADRNAALLQAAARGVRAAEARLVEILAGPTLTTYDARGRKAAIAALSPRAPQRF